MTNIVEKVKKLVESVGAQGRMDLGVNLETGAVAINGIEFTMAEQLQIVKEYRNDPTMSQLISQIRHLPEAQSVRNVVKMDGGTFKVDPVAANKTFGTNLPETATPKVVSMDDMIKAKAQKLQGAPAKDPKDEEIARLKLQIMQMDESFKAFAQEQAEHIEYLVGQLHLADEMYVPEQDLLFPETFAKSPEHVSVIKKLSDAEIQAIVDDLKGVEVPYGSFVLHRTGDTAVLKINDDQGISYLVTKDYYYAHIG